MEETNYKLKVTQNRAELKRIGVKDPLYYFTIKFREYSYENNKTAEYNRLNNLWYSKVQDDDFLEKMNSFVKCKQVEFEN